jgi:hypothetical protein
MPLTLDRSALCPEIVPRSLTFFFVGLRETLLAVDLDAR